MALKLKLVDVKGKEVGEATLSEAVFGVTAREHLMFEAVVAEAASARQGTAKTKGRSEVRGGGVKPYRQKGTGQARRGTSRSPLIVGGGRMFGPVPRDYSYRLPKGMRNEALRTALSQKQREGNLVIVKEFGQKTPKTHEMASLMEQVSSTKALFVDSGNTVLDRAVRNLPNAKYLDVKGLNVRDLLKHDTLVLSSSSLKMIEERLAP